MFMHANSKSTFSITHIHSCNGWIPFSYFHYNARWTNPPIAFSKMAMPCQNKLPVGSFSKSSCTIVFLIISDVTRIPNAQL